jgi:hypothetical protein
MVHARFGATSTGVSIQIAQEHLVDSSEETLNPSAPAGLARDRKDKADFEVGGDLFQMVRGEIRTVRCRYREPRECRTPASENLPSARYPGEEQAMSAAMKEARMPGSSRRWPVPGGYDFGNLLAQLWQLTLAHLRGCWVRFVDGGTEA